MLLVSTLAFLCCSRFATQAEGSDNFILETSYPCEDVPDPKCTIIVKPKTFVPPQIVDMTVITSVPLGKQLKLTLVTDLENILTRNWQHLTTIEDDFCRFLQLYMGPLAHDTETALAIPPGICPVSKGHYHAVNYTLDFSKFRLQGFPFGRLRMTYNVSEKSTRNAVMCTVAIITNKN